MIVDAGRRVEHAQESGPVQRMRLHLHPDGAMAASPRRLPRATATQRLHQSPSGGSNAELKSAGLRSSRADSSFGAARAA